VPRPRRGRRPAGPTSLPAKEGLPQVNACDSSGEQREVVTAARWFPGEAGPAVVLPPWRSSTSADLARWPHWLTADLARGLDRRRIEGEWLLLFSPEPLPHPWIEVVAIGARRRRGRLELVAALRPARLPSARDLRLPSGPVASAGHPRRPGRSHEGGGEVRGDEGGEMVGMGKLQGSPENEGEEGSSCILQHRLQHLLEPK
jgi:hypothetical protein